MDTTKVLSVMQAQQYREDARVNPYRTLADGLTEPLAVDDCIDMAEHYGLAWAIARRVFPVRVSLGPSA